MIIDNLVMVIYGVAMACAMVVAVRSRPDLTYWPAIRLLAVGISSFCAHVALIRALATQWPEFGTDPVQRVARAVLLLLVTGWSAWLVLRQNRMPPSRSLDLGGHEHLQSRAEGLRHLEAACRLHAHQVLTDEEFFGTIRRFSGGWKRDLLRQSRERREARQRGGIE